MKIINKTLIFIVLLGIFIAISSFGNYTFAQQQGRGQQGPPPEAYTACEGKLEGDTAEFESLRGDTVTGTCVQEGDRLVLRPDNLPGGEGMNGYSVVDTGQLACYDDHDELVTCPLEGESFYGQDSQHDGHQSSYTENGDGTVTDNVTGLMWQQTPDTDGDGDIDAADKLSYDDAVAGADTFDLGGYSDWRLPTIKELYSLIDFGGVDPSGFEGSDTSGLVPFINTAYFDFAYGDADAGERIIDAQYASSNLYVATTAGDGGRTLFGVNFADGRIKGYGLSLFGSEKTFFVIYVRGNTGYGLNDVEDNGDGTITDYATELMWSQDDSGSSLNWEDALAWVEDKNAENYLGHSDWRLPNAKELQSIVDYTRSPDTTGSAAIDPLFNATSITNEAGEDDYPCYWSGTTHANWTANSGNYGAYVAFGRAMGYMDGEWVDVHGAGAQRSDPKAGDPSEFPTGHGPQGDAIRIYNYVRLVRDANTEQTFHSNVSDNDNDRMWQQVHIDNKNSWTDAFTDAESLSLPSNDNWLSDSLKELFTISGFEADWSNIDSTSLFLFLTSAEETNQQQYWPANFYNPGTTQDEIDSAVDGNILTVDTQGNVTGIIGKILEVLP